MTTEQIQDQIERMIANLKGAGERYGEMLAAGDDTSGQLASMSAEADELQIWKARLKALPGSWTSMEPIAETRDDEREWDAKIAAARKAHK